jgi:hypothetical protein
MTMKLVPLHDRIVVRRVEEEETTRGGIVIPDAAKDKPQEGEVVAVGQGKVNEKGRLFPRISVSTLRRATLRIWLLPACSNPTKVVRTALRTAGSIAHSC